jgi:hypothetical protein
MKLLVIKTLITSITSLGLLGLFNPNQASAQLIPEPWIAVGSKDSAITYAGGVKVFGFGLEVGTGKDGVTGTDVLKFINLPFISPYLGVGYYSTNQEVSFSGGIHVETSKHIFIGAGYNSVRGFNGQIGIKL